MAMTSKYVVSGLISLNVSMKSTGPCWIGGGGGNQSFTVDILYHIGLKYLASM